MPKNRSALVRYCAIDKCLRDTNRQRDLESLIDACSAALGDSRPISRRTVQLDIENMRGDKLGYNAPIEVYNREYYGNDILLAQKDSNKIRTPKSEYELIIYGFIYSSL